MFTQAECNLLHRLQTTANRLAAQYIQTPSRIRGRVVLTQGLQAFLEAGNHAPFADAIAESASTYSDVGT